MSFLPLPRRKPRCTQGTELSPPAHPQAAAFTLSLDLNEGLHARATGAPNLRTSASSEAEGALGLLSLPGVFNYCNYWQPGKGCKAFKKKRQHRAAQAIPASVNTLPSTKSLELNNNFENLRLFLPDDTTYAGTYATPITMASSASPCLCSDR